VSSRSPTAEGLGRIRNWVLATRDPAVAGQKEASTARFRLADGGIGRWVDYRLFPWFPGSLVPWFPGSLAQTQVEARRKTR